jgi:hypothetical protein
LPRGRGLTMNKKGFVKKKEVLPRDKSLRSKHD